ncbi:oligoendopeptidase F [Paenibacillus sp. SYP-B3998]|uniref:Oligopeptidase F n=1 Tax=Paenibacillus sp. SYP-B3998 TaxID=2678564 RepID=A0A6G3ZT68_9BACL|nr:oligoendopeptidase F [Paenibacillus sp. SYP-B3998]NEW04781.1 oligoendopeptidase F [Paenibacillus sp. SYP-B3998]
MKKKWLNSVTTVAIAVTALSTPFIPLSTETVLAAVDQATETKPSYTTRADIPSTYKWKTDDIYVDKAAWEADVKKVRDLAATFTSKHQNKLGSSSAELKAALDDYTELNRIFDKAYVYGHLRFDVNSSDANMQTLSDGADALSTDIGSKLAWFTVELNAISDDQLKTLLSSQELKAYKIFVEDKVRTKTHILSKEMEEALAKTAPLSLNPEDTFKMLTKDIKFPTIKDENGKDVQLSRSNFITYMESKNRDVRKSAFEAYYGTLEKYQDTFSKTLGGEVQANNINANLHKYGSALDSALTPNNVPTKVYDELVDTVDRNLPLLHRYMDVKKKLLGVDQLHMYDIYTPVVEYQERYIPYEEGKKMVLDGLKPMGEAYVNVLKGAFDKGWVDVYPTDDKRSGAYQWGAFDTHPYVLLNYEGTYDSVSTIAHELGHAMQSYYTNSKQNYVNSNYPIFTAEVASTMNETLMFKSMYANAKSKQEKLYLLNQYLENFRTTMFRQTQFAEFERAIHETAQKGESLNAETLKKLYLDINKKYYGPTIVSDDEIAMEWSRIPHFYYGYYVYQYATSFAASAALANQVLTEGQPAVDRIRDNFLSAGNSASPIDVLKAAGVDMSSPKPIEEAMKVFEGTLNEFEKLVAELEKESSLKVTVNGKEQSFKQAPVNLNGNVLLPTSGVFDTLGAIATWNDDKKSITITKGDKKIVLTIDAETATVDDNVVALEQKAQLVNEDKMVPVRFIAEALGAKVTWDNDTHTVIVVTE